MSFCFQGFAHVSTEIFIKVTSTRKVWGWCWGLPCIKKWIPQGKIKKEISLCHVTLEIDTPQKPNSIRIIATPDLVKIYMYRAESIIQGNPVMDTQLTIRI